MPELSAGCPTLPAFLAGGWAFHLRKQKRCPSFLGAQRLWRCDNVVQKSSGLSRRGALRQNTYGVTPRLTLGQLRCRVLWRYVIVYTRSAFHRRSTVEARGTRRP